MVKIKYRRTLHQNAIPSFRHPAIPSSRASKNPSISPRFSAFLTGSVPQTEIDLTHSKQTTENFLTGSKTAIKLFMFCTRPTRSLAQVNHRNRHVTLATSHFSLATDSPFSTRFCQISRKRRNSLKTNAGQISTRGHNRMPRVFAFHSSVPRAGYFDSGVLTSGLNVAPRSSARHLGFAVVFGTAQFDARPSEGQGSDLAFVAAAFSPTDFWVTDAAPRTKMVAENSDPRRLR